MPAAGLGACVDECAGRIRWLRAWLPRPVSVEYTDLVEFRCRAGSDTCAALVKVRMVPLDGMLLDLRTVREALRCLASCAEWLAEELACAIAEMLRRHQGQHIVVLDVRLDVIRSGTHGAVKVKVM